MWRVYHRTWWREPDPEDPEDAGYPGGLVPGAGKKRTIRIVERFAEAVEIAVRWNSTHEPGKYSDRAEIEVYERKKRCRRS